MSHLAEALRVVLGKNVLRKPEEISPEEPIGGGYMRTGYHATPLDNYESITKFGLIPGKSSPGGQDWKGKYSGKGTYFHLAFPEHEIDNAVMDDELINIIFEARFTVSPEEIVADEEFGDPIDTAQVMEDKMPVAIGIKVMPAEIEAIHLPDIEDARDWVEENNVRGDHKVEYHKVGG